MGQAPGSEREKQRRPWFKGRRLGFGRLAPRAAGDARRPLPGGQDAWLASARWSGRRGVLVRPRDVLTWPRPLRSFVGLRGEREKLQRREREGSVRARQRRSEPGGTKQLQLRSHLAAKEKGKGGGATLVRWAVNGGWAWRLADGKEKKNHPSCRFKPLLMYCHFSLSFAQNSR